MGSYKTNVGVNAAGAGVSTGAVAVANLTQLKIDSGGLNGSRWGIRVSEDLGGGLSVTGNLESGINLDVGSSAQGGLLFGRRAAVGLRGSFGTVLIGRNSSPYDDVSSDHSSMAPSPFDPANTNNGPSTATAGALNTASGAAAMLNRDGRAWLGYNTRFNNSVKYTTPVMSGFSASAMYALGEDKTTAVGASQSISANVKYANGPLLVSGAYQSEAGPRTAIAQPALENALLSFSYDFQVVKLGVGFNRATLREVLAGGASLAPQKEFSISASVPVGAATLSAAYAQGNGNDLGKSSGFGVQAIYAMSKRTTLYAGAVNTKPFDKLTARTKTAFLTSSVGNTLIYAAGIRHTF